jgi:nicotinate-nucleotide pyrophosphorylase (carboxylating)
LKRSSNKGTEAARGLKGRRTKKAAGVHAKEARKTEGLAGLYKYSSLLVKAALAEDVGSGDITTDAVVTGARTGLCKLVAKEDLVLSGLFLAEMAFKECDAGVDFEPFYKDGERVRKGRTIAAVSGRLAALLTGERVALNFLQRLSGIATLTDRYVRKVGARNQGVKILDTRKTTPCMRKLERYAVKSGGGYNHRAGLYDLILIKDNHIKAAGGLAEAIRKVQRKYRGSVAVEAEARNLREVSDAVRGEADIIMLDNMDVDAIKKSMKAIDNRALVEVSGGVTLGNVGAIASTGVDFISVGALTHSAPSVDISMDVVADARKRRR